MEKLSEVEVLKFKYDSEEERNTHVENMKKEGYEVSLKRKHNNNYYNLNSKEYWYGEFFKYK